MLAALSPGSEDAEVQLGAVLADDDPFLSTEELLRKVEGRLARNERSVRVALPLGWLCALLAVAAAVSEPRVLSVAGPSLADTLALMSAVLIVSVTIFDRRLLQGWALLRDAKYTGDPSDARRREMLVEAARIVWVSERRAGSCVLVRLAVRRGRREAWALAHERQLWSALLRTGLLYALLFAPIAAIVGAALASPQP